MELHCARVLSYDVQTYAHGRQSRARPAPAFGVQGSAQSAAIRKWWRSACARLAVRVRLRMRRYTAPPPLLQLSPPRQAAGCARAALFVKTPVVEVQERGQGGREAFKKEGGGTQGREMAFQKQEGHAEGRCGIRRQGFYAQRVRLSAESSAKTAPPDSASLPCGPPREQAVWSMDDAGESSWCSDKCASHIVEDIHRSGC